MFTVKFYKITGEESTSDSTGSIMHSFQVPHYSAHERPCGRVTIALYKDLYDIDGVEKHVSDHNNDYSSCYVENASGKTVASWKTRSSNLTVGSSKD